MKNMFDSGVSIFHLYHIMSAMLHFIIEDKVLIFIYSNSTVNPLQLNMILKTFEIQS